MSCAGCGSCECGKDDTRTPEEVNAYYTGLIDGVYMYAWWKDGVQYVGTTGRMLCEALENIEEERTKALAK